ncbi:MAG: response regulator [Bacteroidota bacterium]
MADSYILIAEDDSDDRFLLQAAFEENGFQDKLHFTENGIELMSFLQSVQTSGGAQGLPRFILLDLNMPKKDGREVLKELKEDIVLKKIPIVVFSTTNSEHEMNHCYELGANSYITKPNSFEALMQTIANLRNYWMQTSNTPL